MKHKLKYFPIILISIVTGWFLGFVKVPYINASQSYYLGFISCISFILFSICFHWIWNENNVKFENSLFSLKKWFAPALTSAALIFGIFNFWKNNQLQIQLNKTELDLSVAKEENNIEDEKLKLGLLQNLIQTYDGSKANATESKNIIERIVALSNTLKVHKEWDPISFKYKELSTMRGMFLLSLIQSKIDSTSFAKIKNNVSFAYSDLRMHDLRGKDLNGIDLAYSDLVNSSLEGINLNNSNLRGANLQGANIEKSTLQGASLISANLKWAKFNGADLQRARLDSADLNNVNLQNSKLNFVTFIETNMQNAILNESDLRNSFLLGANFADVNLSKALLANITVNRTNLHEANLNEIIIQNNWIEKIKEDDEVLIKNLLEKYKFVIDTISIKDSIIYKLISNN